MNRRVLSLIQAGVFVLLVVGAFYSISDACTFVAFVRDPDPNQPFPLMRYDSIIGYEVVSSGANVTHAGWSISWYPHTGTPPFQTRRWSRLNTTCPSPWESPNYYRGHERPLPAADQANVAIVHARRAGTDEILNPHPFVYDNVGEYQHGIFGKTYAYIHNGLLDVNVYRDHVDPAFAALDLFYHRSYGGLDWHQTVHIVDTEYLGMLMMKYLLVQDNYYWDDPDTHLPTYDLPWTNATPEEWATRRMAQIFPRNHEDWDAATSSINGVLTDGSQLWVLARSDGVNPHKVYYHDSFADPVNTAPCREVESKSSETEFNHNPISFTLLDEDHGGHVIRLSGDPDDTPPTGGTQIMDDLQDPTELRINSASDVAGDQTAPAISANPADGSWIGVWMSGGAVVGRWYDQMGLAEHDEFVISAADPDHPQSDPAVAYSATGDKITVVWVRGSADHQDIYASSYQFEQLTHAYSLLNGPESIYQSNTLGQVGHPSVVYDQWGGHAAVWQASNPPFENRPILGKVWDSNGGLIFSGAISTLLDVFCDSPDIAYAGGPDYAYAIVYNVGQGVGIRGCMLSEITAQVSGHLTLPNQTGTHPTIASTMDGARFYVAYNDGSLKVAVCRNLGISFDVLQTATGEAMTAGTRPDIATRRSSQSDRTYFVCYQVTGSGQDIHCAYGIDDGNAPIVEPAANQYVSNDQTSPVIAIAPAYPINRDHLSRPFYAGHSNNDVTQRLFETRRMVIWQSYGQDQATADWGISGQFRGIKQVDNSVHTWSEEEPIVDLPWVFPTRVAVNTVISAPTCILPGGGVVVDPGVTLTISAGVTVLAESGATMDIQGNLVANSVTFDQADPEEANPYWKGIHVSGSASLYGCVINGAVIGVRAEKPASLGVDQCTFEKDSLGIYIYAPTGSGQPSITNCIISGCTADGISMLSTPAAVVTECQILSNGTDGVLLTNSSPKISTCTLSANKGYGINCYGGSPTLYCNHFDNDQTGEMLLTNGSYPVLWKTSGVDGGANTFVNSGRTLIKMADSYPVCAYGGNQFTLYGSGGYFMEDVSKYPPKHDVSYNVWSPDPHTPKTFYPDLAYFTVDPQTTYGGCDTPKGASSNAALATFTQGYTAEMAGDPAAASTAYTQTITTYPDSSWAQVAAARLLENQLQMDSGFANLGNYYATLVSTYAADTILAQTAQDLSTRTLVEDHEYGSALDAYQSIMLNPPSEADSIYAAVDYAITALRAAYDSTQSNLDAALPVMSAQALQNLRHMVDGRIPEAPQAQHENFLPAPQTVVLEQNYPNPFNATTTLRYSLPAAGQVRLSIYNLMGQKVVTLVDATQASGYHSVSWDGRGVASGVYVYRLETCGRTLSEKMLLLK